MKDSIEKNSASEGAAASVPLALGSVFKEMSPEERDAFVVPALHAGTGKPGRITYRDGVLCFRSDDGLVTVRMEGELAQGIRTSSETAERILEEKRKQASALLRDPSVIVDQDGNPVSPGTAAALVATRNMFAYFAARDFHADSPEPLGLPGSASLQKEFEGIEDYLGMAKFLFLHVDRWAFDPDIVQEGNSYYKHFFCPEVSIVKDLGRAWKKKIEETKIVIWREYCELGLSPRSRTEIEGELKRRGLLEDSPKISLCRLLAKFRDNVFGLCIHYTERD